MKVLIDTHTFLWWNTDDPLLSARAKEIIADGRNEIFLSAASVWEIVIKTAKGRLILPEAPAAYISSRMSLYRFRSLAIQISHAAHVYELPPYHNDPFDRMLVAQSQLESLPLVTKNEDIRRYDLQTIW
ncbi:MAG: type II toxin-antitoxin system VapC family toxin [Anaerolineales bacterium]|nr:type II toxin-antitoxin system VapC family toxin [Anaerolineales bacterium]